MLQFWNWKSFSPNQNLKKNTNNNKPKKKKKKPTLFSCEVVKGSLIL